MNNKDEVQAHVEREEARIRTDEAFHGIKSPSAQPVQPKLPANLALADEAVQSISDFCIFTSHA